MPGRLTGSKHFRQTGQVSSTSAPHFGQRMGMSEEINPDEPGSKGKGNEKQIELRTRKCNMKSVARRIFSASFVHHFKMERDYERRD